MQVFVNIEILNVSNKMFHASRLRKMCCRYNELAECKPVRVDLYVYYYCFDVCHQGCSRVRNANVNVTKPSRLPKNGSIVSSRRTSNSPHLERVPIGRFFSKSFICI